MTKHTIPFSLDIRVGDSTLQEALSVAIEVNLYDDPKDDEINRWTWDLPAGHRDPHLPYRMSNRMERLAIEQARRQLAKDRGDQKIENAS